MKNDKYSIGLDIGNTSVGWAVIGNDTQRLVKKGKGKERKTLWGVRLFEDAKTAAERRNFRSSRRRYDRRRWRIKLLQSIFKEEIEKIDKNFYTKLRESFYNENDDSNKTIKILKEEKKKIKEYNNKYKTIYHLRNRLITDNSKEDLRLVYLAIHHIIKYRGNFLYESDNFKADNLNVEEKLENIFFNVFDIYNLDNPNIDFNNLSKILLEESKNDVKSKTSEVLKNYLPKEFVSEFIKMINGNKFDFTKMFSIEIVENVKLSFNGSEYDDKYDEFCSLVGDNIELLDSLKQLYDMLFLKKLFKGSNQTNISSLMAQKYEKHKKDLRLLKEILDNNRKEYNHIFRSNKDICVYEKYISNQITKDDFYKEISNCFSKISNNDIKQNLMDDL